MPKQVYASPGPYRTVKNGSAETKGYEVPLGDHFVNYVEFDEFGIPYREEQQKAVETHLETIETELKSAGKSALILVFVHGWHNNAVSANAESFEKKVVEIGTALGGKTRVYGIYVAWPGEGIALPGLNLSTFWNRKSVGNSVGMAGGVTSLILRLQAFYDQHRSSNGEPAVNLVFVGHSFGAQVLYTSTTQLLLQNALYDHAEQGRLERLSRENGNRASTAKEGVPSEIRAKSLGDLVVLVNPAFEANRFYAVNQTLRQFRYRNKFPTVLIVASETDSATKLFFPLGRSLTFRWFFRNYTPNDTFTPAYDQQSSELAEDFRTIPFSPNYLTHRLGYFPAVTSSDDVSTFAFKSTKEGVPVLKKIKQGPLDSPIAVALAEKAVINGHNDIWKETFSDFLKQFIVEKINSGERR